jgi:hypothetical protein
MRASYSYSYGVGIYTRHAVQYSYGVGIYKALTVHCRPFPSCFLVVFDELVSETCAFALGEGERPARDSMAAPDEGAVAAAQPPVPFWQARADALTSSLEKVSARCSRLEGLRVEAEERYRDAEARMQRRISGEADTERQLRDLRLELASARRDIEQLCKGVTPTDRGWRKEAGPEVEEQLACVCRPGSQLG